MKRVVLHPSKTVCCPLALTCCSSAAESTGRLVLDFVFVHSVFSDACGHCTCVSWRGLEWCTGAALRLQARSLHQLRTNKHVPVLQATIAGGGVRVSHLQRGVLAPCVNILLAVVIRADLQAAWSVCYRVCSWASDATSHLAFMLKCTFAGDPTHPQEFDQQDSKEGGPDVNQDSFSC